MKLDHPSMFAFEHSAGGFGMSDTPTSDEGTYVGPISLHNAIAVVCWCRGGDPIATRESLICGQMEAYLGAERTYFDRS
jgi:hypothetical protein